jgi:hypothetical protein
MFLKKIVLASSILFSLSTFGQTQTTADQTPAVIKKIEYPELKKNFNETGTHYIKSTIVAQIWSRYTDFNPGTTLNGYGMSTPFDIGIRRLRFNILAQPTDRIFFYVQFGQNNFNFTSKLNVGSFFHDAVGEFRVHPTKLSIGTGLSGWSGLTRFSAPAVGSILGLDAPLYQQVTNGINDQFLRKLSIYAKGQIGKFDYRVAVSNPMTYQSSLSSNTPVISSTAASFSYRPPHLQTQGYLSYQFFEKENNTLAYTAGTYHGKKKIFNLGAGWIEQKNALWHKSAIGDTINDNMVLLGTDIFTEIPLSEKRNAISAYVALTDYQMGKNYIRYQGPMNTANGLNGSTSAAGGNTAPIIGTGRTLFTQLAYKFKDNLLPNQGSIQIYGSVQASKYQALNSNLMMYEAGINWLINGDHHSKLTLSYQSRPTYNIQADGYYNLNTRRGMAVLQYQITL